MKKAIIFDIDGTLADLTHRLHYITGGDSPDWDAFYKACPDDTSIEPTVSIYILMKENLPEGHVLILCTGRRESIRRQTERWLYHRLIKYDHLMMRRFGDHRDDVEVKRQMLNALREFYDPILVFEDRSSVVQMWREEGLQCFQVAEGDF